MHGHKGDVVAVAFSPDGHWLATASKDNTACLWDVTNPTAEPVVLQGHEGGVVAVAFSPDGRWLATASEDNTAWLWDVTNPTAEPVVLQGHGGGIVAMVFSPDGAYLAVRSFEESSAAQPGRERLVIVELGEGRAEVGDGGPLDFIGWVGSDAQ